MQFNAADLVARLRTFAANTDHEFWPDDVTVRDGAAVAADRLHATPQVTDVSRPALAVRHRGGLATFDRSVPCPRRPARRRVTWVVI